MNIGQKNQTEHDARYNFAEEYLEVCYKLWEEGAILRDRERRTRVGGGDRRGQV